MKQFIIVLIGIWVPIVIYYFIPVEWRHVPFQISLALFALAWQRNSYKLEQL